MLTMIDGLRACLRDGRQAVIATILAVAGSVYQRDGARCLICDDGQMIGIVSGGCVEKDLYEYAQEVLRTGEPKQIEYDFRKPDDAVWGLGLGCNGAMSVWLQPFDPCNHSDAARVMLAMFEHRHVTTCRYICGTVVSSQDASKIAVGQMVEFDVSSYPTLFETDQPTCMIVEAEIAGTKVRMFVEGIEPRPTLLIYGAGTDASPLVDMAKFVEWRVVLVDHRSDFANVSRFPSVDEIVILSREAYGTLPLTPSTFVVIMTHNYTLDKQTLAAILPQNIPYLGQLGPTRRTSRMVAEIEAAGLALDESWLAKLHAPIGLDIGAILPNEIALAIMAEAMSRANGRDGGHLRSKSGLLHPRASKNGTGNVTNG